MLAQIDAKQKEMSALQDPVILAQLYSIEQIALKYEAAQQAVITAKRINVILAPDAFVWAPESVDVTTAIACRHDHAASRLASFAPDWYAVPANPAVD